MNMVKVGAKMLALAMLASVAVSSAAMDMGGEWRVTGEGLDGVARLPGTLGDAKLGKEQSYGTWNAISNKQERYALRLQHQFIGEATWSRKVTVPAELAGKPLELFLERVMWKSTLKVDGRTVGSCDSLAAPHVYRFAAGELAAGEHLFEIAVDNRALYGFAGWSHAWGPTTQTRWNGIIGRFELREANALRRARVFAKWPADGRFEIDLPAGARLSQVEVDGLQIREWERKGDRVTVKFGGEVVYWSEWHPRLYTLRLHDGEGFVRTVRFGFRTLERRGNRIYLNGKPFWMRGNVDNCQFPLTGYPAMKRAEWRRQIRIQQLNGCNSMRFHTWTPPEAAFEAADELGFLMMAEIGYWADRWMGCTSVGGGDSEHDNFVRTELRRLQDAYGDHPSLMSVGFGNELGSCDFGLLDSWMQEAKAYDNRYLAIVSTARKVCPSDDFMTTHNYPGIGSVRCWRHPHTDWDYEKAYSKAPLPVIAHEIGQWPVYPYWDDMSRFSGLLKAYDWMWMRSLAEKNGTLRFTRRWHAASLKTNRLMYKDEVESFMRTPSCAGLQLLDMRDYTGQGEALIGWLDADFGAKSALSEVGAFSSIFRSVPFLARFGKYTWTAGETFEAKLQIRNLTESPIPAGMRYPWSFAGRQGYMTLEKDLAPYEIATLGEVRVALEDWMASSRQTLRFGENDWGVWVFPREERAAVPAGVVVTADFGEALASLAKGGTVVYTGKSSIVGKGAFEPVYWSSIHFPSKDPSVALGTWFDEDHPVFAGFPTGDWMDWQWRSLADGATVHVLRNAPDGFDAIAMPVSDIHFSEFLATMFELRALKGRMFVCGYSLDADTPESRALRRSVFDYVSGEAFAPAFEVSEDRLRKMMLSDPKAVKELSASEYRVERSGPEMKISVLKAAPVQGRFAVRFFSDGDLEGEFEGRACRKEMAIDGEMRLVSQMNREDALDGKFLFRCRAKTGSMPRFAGIEIIPE
jgi:hypothetical protein